MENTQSQKTKKYRLITLLNELNEKKEFFYRIIFYDTSSDTHRLVVYFLSLF